MAVQPQRVTETMNSPRVWMTGGLGAAVGWAVGGPVGAVIGGPIGLAAQRYLQLGDMFWDTIFKPFQKKSP